MKYLRMTFPHEVIAPASIVTEGSLLNVQLLPDGTLLELALIRANPDEICTAMEMSTTTDHFAREVVESQNGQWYIYQHCRPTNQARELLQLLNEHRLMIMFPILFDEETGLTIEIIGGESDIQDGFDALPPEVRQRTSIERVGEYSPMDARVVSRWMDHQSTGPQVRDAERERSFQTYRVARVERESTDKPQGVTLRRLTNTDSRLVIAGGSDVHTHQSLTPTHLYA